MKKEAASRKTIQKSIKAKTRRPQTKGNKMEKEGASRKTKKIHESLITTALNQRQ